MGCARVFCLPGGSWSYRRLTFLTRLTCTMGLAPIRPHRFGGEGVLIGVQFGYTKCSSHICLYGSRYISFNWGGALKIFAPKPFRCWCFRNFSDDFWALDLKRVLRCNFVSFWGGSGNRTWEASGNGKTDNNEKKIANTDDSKGSLWGLFRKDGLGLGGWVTFKGALALS